ncbi:uncharacterized protein LOC144156056 [Haemaphysalis longicornis]
MDVKFIKTQKGKDALVFEDCKYCLQRKILNGMSAWRCSKYCKGNCRAAQLNKLEDLPEKVDKIEESISIMSAEYDEVLVTMARQGKLLDFGIKTIQFIKTLTEHTHPPDSKELSECRFKNSLKETARQRPHTSAPEIYNQEMLGLVGKIRPAESAHSEALFVWELPPTAGVGRLKASVI